MRTKTHHAHTIHRYADPWWRTELAGRASFSNATSNTLCGLVKEGDARQRVQGAVVYENGLPYGTGYTLAMALTIASQQSLLPVTEAMLAKHPCLAALSIKADLRIANM